MRVRPSRSSCFGRSSFGGIEAVADSEEGRSPESYEYPETLGMSRIVSLFAVQTAMLAATEAKPKMYEMVEVSPSARRREVMQLPYLRVVHYLRVERGHRVVRVVPARRSGGAQNRLDFPARVPEKRLS